MKKVKKFIRNINKSKHPGFTLMELVVVVVVIGILSAAVGAGYMSYASNARYSTAETDLRALKGMLDQYSISHQGTYIGLFPNGETTGDLTGSSTISGLDKGETILTKPLNSIYDPWGHPYQVYANYNTTTQQGDIVIYVQADATSGLQAKDVVYKTITVDGTESTFTVSNVAINPNKKPKGGTTSQGEPMAIRVLGQYEIM